MKRKDLSEEQRAWEDFKFVTFNSAMIAFGLGAIVILFVRDFLPSMLLILFAPISYFFAWRYFPKRFLKNEIKP